MPNSEQLASYLAELRRHLREAALLAKGTRQRRQRTFSARHLHPLVGTPSFSVPDFAMPAAVQELLDRLKRGEIPPFDANHFAASPAPQPVREAPPPLPEGAQFLAARFANQAGARPYRLFVPSGYRGDPVPLVVMLHGCTQSPEDFAAGTRMNELGEEQIFLVAYPGQTSSANHAKCWNWFETVHQQRDSGEPSIIAGITRAIMTEYVIDPSRVYIAGMSAGGAQAAIMAATYPDLYAAVGIHSGLACGSASDIAGAFAAMRQGGGRPGRRESPILHERHVVPAIVFHGESDNTVHCINGDEIIAHAASVRPLLKREEAGRARGGQAYRRTLYAEPTGETVLEHWIVQGAAHAWSGGSLSGSYTDPAGPDASGEMVRFFNAHPMPPRPSLS